MADPNASIVPEWPDDSVAETALEPFEAEDDEEEDDEDDDDLRVEVTASMYLDKDLEYEDKLRLLVVQADLLQGAKSIGSGVFHVFENARWHDVWDSCDAAAADLEMLASAIIGPGGVIDRRLFAHPMGGAHELVFIERFWIEPEHRGRGLGSEFFQRAIPYVTKGDDAILVTFPSPRLVTKHPTRSDWARVRRFWKKQGFTHIKDNVFVGPYRAAFSRWDYKGTRGAPGIGQWRKGLTAPLPRQQSAVKSVD